MPADHAAAVTAVQFARASVAPSRGKERDALVLVNLGTPEAPTPSAVRKYLAEFLSDPCVVQIPPLLWQPLLRGVVLPLRARRAADKYASVWMAQGSPLAVHTQALARAVQLRLPQMQVRLAMRYGQPALAQLLQDLCNAGMTRILVLPLYPQYSTTTTASVAGVVQAVAGACAAAPAWQFIDDYHLDPGWVGAVAEQVRAHWREHGRGERLLCSYHGLPQRLADAGDPYPDQCQASTAALAAALDLPSDQLLLTYQSRFGRERWLQPYTFPTLQALARAGVRTLDIVCPGFAVDCLETLEEIEQRATAVFRAAGGAALRYIPCLNATAAHADVLAALARTRIEAWPVAAAGS